MVAVSHKDREALQEAVYQFVKDWLEENDVNLLGDEVGKLLEVVVARFTTEYHAERTRRGLNKHGERM